MFRGLALNRFPCRGASLAWRLALALGVWSTLTAAAHTRGELDVGAPSENAAAFTPQARLAAMARMWSAKHRDDLAMQAMQKALLIAPADPMLLAQAIRIELRLG